jgi:hypothetical protein
MLSLSYASVLTIEKDIVIKNPPPMKSQFCPEDYLTNDQRSQSEQTSKCEIFSNIDRYRIFMKAVKFSKLHKKDDESNRLMEISRFIKKRKTDATILVKFKRGISKEFIALNHKMSIQDVDDILTNFL